MENVRAHIAELLARSIAPAVLWSGGKDSAVLLHIVREQAPEATAVWFDVGGPKPAPPAISWAPADVYLLLGETTVLVHEYDWGGTRLPLLTDLAHGPRCSLTAFPHRTPHIYPPFDMLFVGWKDCDTHWIPGTNLLPEDGTMLGQAELVAPLRHWTNDQVRAATVTLGITYDTTDELPLCTLCMQPGNDTVWCSERQCYIPRVDWPADAALNAFRTRFNIEESTNGQSI